MHFSRLAQFGYSNSGLNTLKSFYGILHQYAAATDRVVAQQGLPIAVTPIVEGLNFDNGTGARLIAGSLSWDGYTAQLEGAVNGVVDLRQSIGMDAGDVIDWWSHAMQQLPVLGLAENAGQAFKPAGEAAAEGFNAALDAIPLWVKVGGGAVLGIIILAQLAPVIGLFGKGAGYVSRAKAYVSRAKGTAKRARDSVRAAHQHWKSKPALSSHRRLKR